MIPLNEAQRAVLEHAPLMQIERLPIQSSLGYVLAQDITANEPSPLFDNSAMDGYAIRAEDVAKATGDHPIKLKMQGMIQAGDNPEMTLQRGYAIRIFTGAVVPNGANAVVMQEDVNRVGDEAYFSNVAHLGDHVRKQGDEFSIGDKLFSSGVRITPPLIGMLATLGYPEVAVYSKPKVSLIVTGDELQPVTASLQVGQIYESNSYALTASLNAIGITPYQVLRVKDDRDDLTEAFRSLIDSSDIVISVGGVSVGEFDFVKDVVEKLGARSIFYKVAMKPGKPNYFGIKGSTLIFGLPGNPVSAMVSFRMFPRLAISRMMGLIEDERICLSAQLTTDLKKKPGRLSLIRGIVKHEKTGVMVVTPATGQGSHMMSGLTQANCLIHFPKDEERLDKGSQVDVELIQWSSF